MTKRARIDEVAALAGVSKATVSRVLNGRFDEMGAETRARVERAIKALKYTPDSLARGLKVRRTHLIGMLVTDINNRFTTGVIEGAEEVCRRAGYNLVIANSAQDERIERETLMALHSRRVDGLIVNPTGRNDDLFKRLSQEDYPIVFLDRKGTAVGDMVTVDSFRGACAAVDHLADLGHTRIGIILSHPADISPRAERLAGYKAVLERRGLPFDPALVSIVPYQPGGPAAGTERLLSLPDPPTAIFSTSGVMHLEVLATLRRQQLKVPADISVIAFDDPDWGAFVDPPLTAVAQPLRELGADAAEKLLARLDGRKVWRSTTTLMEPSLILRASCGRPSR